MRAPILHTLAIVAALAGSTPTAHAWGAAGHQIVATIAQIHLPAPVLRLVCDILHPGQPLSAPAPVLSSSSSSSASSSPPCTLASVAAWADQVRGQPAYRYTAPLHYVNARADAPLSDDEDDDAAGDGAGGGADDGGAGEPTERGSVGHPEDDEPLRDAEDRPTALPNEAVPIGLIADLALDNKPKRRRRAPAKPKEGESSDDDVVRAALPRVC